MDARRGLRLGLISAARLAFAAAVYVAGAVLASAAEAPRTRPPDVLWLIADDHAPYVSGAYGNAKARTPNLDRLAASGLRFDRAYCNSPVCTASRQSFLTGRLPSAIGVTQLQTPLGDEPTTLAELLRERGYATAALGKMHLNRRTEPGMHGFDLFYDMPEIAAELKARGPLPIPEGIAVQPPWKPFRDPARVWLNAAALPTGRMEADMPSRMVADRAVAFLRERAAERSDGGDAAARPFFLLASFYEPHSPFHFPVEDAGSFDPADFDPPEPGPEDDGQIPEEFRDLTRDEKRGIVAAYYASTAFMDRCVGRVLDALDELGLAETTLVVYLGDHGYNLGHHGRFEKHCFFEPAVRAPLIVRAPGAPRAGEATDALVEFADVFPTIAEACGAPIPEEVEGRSLAPLLRGETARHRDRVFSEYTHFEEAMVRDDRFKLIYRTNRRDRTDGYATGRPLPAGPTTLLYDLEADPEELRNLAALPEHAERIASMKRTMAERFARANGEAPAESAVGVATDPTERLEEWLVPPEERRAPRAVRE